MNYRVAKVRTPGKVKMQNENTWGEDGVIKKNSEKAS